MNYLHGEGVCVCVCVWMGGDCILGHCTVLHDRHVYIFQFDPSWTPLVRSQ